MINLGTKQPDYSKSPATAGGSDAPMRTEYPVAHIKTDRPMKFPDGPFHAKVKMRAKGGEWSTDEKGKKHYTHHMEMMGIHPKMEALDDDGDDDAGMPESSAEEKKDAATHIMEAMSRVRQKKITTGE